MNSLLRLAIVAMLLAVPLSALAMHHEVKVAEKAGIGHYLTDAEGKTLYWFKKDMPGMSACSGGCVGNWPIFYRESVMAPAEAAAADFATITREDGQQQTTFRGYPLYCFAGDSAAGETNGQGLKEVWFVVDPGNFPPH
ncbi:hypothetical protein JCM30471_24670 [Desulfuromonas carbonis]|uniref:COG4315 family predicted lipoprotein n=1 Tax=Desulfuromonas sp. DDH964 TaxID=1823759 RepID=UPI00078CB54A|nr:hypothetical protein [Desulfuromonas sp. DDH964]AMV70472.1 hypothetical protein DBW_0071 [Desulfuromonas sp. DDH964]